MTIFEKNLLKYDINKMEKYMNNEDNKIHVTNILQKYLSPVDEIEFLRDSDIKYSHQLFIIHNNGKQNIFEIFKGKNINILCDIFINFYIPKIRNHIEIGSQNIYDLENEYKVIYSIIKVIKDNQGYLDKEKKIDFWSWKTFDIVYNVIGLTFHVDTIICFVELIMWLNMFHRDLSKKDYLSSDNIKYILHHSYLSFDEMSETQQNKLRDFIEYFDAKSPVIPEATSAITPTTYRKKTKFV
tara:strand:- start:418 stop:1140 length:723 start_codon:yes stop_codon:yes gene_type:complete